MRSPDLIRQAGRSLDLPKDPVKPGRQFFFIIFLGYSNGPRVAVVGHSAGVSEREVHISRHHCQVTALPGTKFEIEATSSQNNPLFVKLKDGEIKVLRPNK